MALNTRKADGLPRWPIGLLVGREGSGKTHTALEAAASDLISRTFYVGVDERDPDDFAYLGDFDIVAHDGTVTGILATLDAINLEDDPDEKPSLLVVDGASRYWALLAENKHREAAARPRSRTSPTAEVSGDQWYDAGREWREMFDRLRAHRGPVVLTARLELEREWKIEGHKTLPFDCDLIVELPEAGEYVIRKAPSRLGIVGRTVVDEFSFDATWRALGLADGTAGERFYSRTRPDETKRPEDTSGRDWAAEAAVITDPAELAQLANAAAAAHASPEVRKAIRDRAAAIGKALHDQKKKEGAPAPTKKKGTA